MWRISEIAEKLQQNCDYQLFPSYLNHDCHHHYNYGVFLGPGGRGVDPPPATALRKQFLRHIKENFDLKLVPPPNTGRPVGGFGHPPTKPLPIWFRVFLCSRPGGGHIRPHFTCRGQFWGAEFPPIRREELTRPRLPGPPTPNSKFKQKLHPPPPPPPHQQKQQLLLQQHHHHHHHHQQQHKQQQQHHHCHYQHLNHQRHMHCQSKRF